MERLQEELKPIINKVISLARHISAWRTCTWNARLDGGAGGPLPKEKAWMNILGLGHPLKVVFYDSKVVTMKYDVLFKV